MLFTLVGFFGLGCADASILATHFPMHPSANAHVTLKAEAEGPIRQIQLAYELYTLSEAEDGSRVQTLTQPLKVIKTCPGASASDIIVCSHTVVEGFADATLVRFVAIADDTGGRRVSDVYAFAAGAYPWKDDPVPIRATGDPRARLDLVLVPDEATIGKASRARRGGPLAVFRSQLADIVDGLYFRYPAHRDRRFVYNYYYSERPARYQGDCVFTLPRNQAQLGAVADVLVVMHDKELEDCRLGQIMSSEIGDDRALLHGAGHALFGLEDEYCCDGSYAQRTCEPNVWSSLANCEADAVNLGAHPDRCKQIASETESVDFWRLQPPDEGHCLMDRDRYVEGSERSCPAEQRRIDWRHEQCLGGTCFSTPECP